MNVDPDYSDWVSYVRQLSLLLEYFQPDSIFRSKNRLDFYANFKK